MADDNPPTITPPSLAQRCIDFADELDGEIKRRAGAIHGATPTEISFAADLMLMYAHGGAAQRLRMLAEALSNPAKLWSAAESAVARDSADRRTNAAAASLDAAQAHVATVAVFIQAGPQQEDEPPAQRH